MNGMTAGNPRKVNLTLCCLLQINKSLARVNCIHRQQQWKMGLRLSRKTDPMRVSMF